MKSENENEQILNKAGWLLFYLYIILLSYFLFFSERYGRSLVSEEYRYNLELFKEIRRFIRYRENLGLENFVVNILGNILAFAPYGFLLPFLNKRYYKFISVFGSILLFSLTVELIQLIFKVGIFDVDDLVLNTTGGIVGYIGFKVFRVIRSKLKSKVERGNRVAEEEK